MAPNQAIGTRFGPAAQLETFLLSNISPQMPGLNQGPWRLMEDAIVNRAVYGRELLYVIVGPIFVDDDEFTFLPSGIEIPTGFFCIIADVKGDGRIQTQSFIIPQKASRKDDFRQFVTSVDYVESESGWNFFSELPDEEQARFESELTPLWLDTPP